MIAMGEKLGIVQDDVTITGNALELRIYAEDPLTFMPSPGTITGIEFPELSDKVRLDHALEVGMKVSPFYDPMLAKLIVHDTSRHKAIELMKRSLSRFHIEGVKTTIPMGLLIMESDAFEDGNFHTDTLASVLQASQSGL